ncbi:hypothetical protein [Desulfurobacterium sp.]
MEVIRLKGNREKAMLYRRLLWRARVKKKVSELRVDQYGDTIDVYCLPSEREVVSDIIANAYKHKNLKPLNLKPAGEVRVERTATSNHRQRRYKVELCF